MALKTQYSESGFALAWAAVLTLIAGMAALTMVNVIQNQQVWSTVSATQDNINEMLEVLTAYQRNEHSMPCPASLSEPIDSANFGVARNLVPIAGICDNSGAADVGHTELVLVGAQYVRIGAFPNRTLGIPDYLTQDKWGNRLYYAVTEELTDPFAFDSANGAITIVDDGGTIATQMGFIIVSQGSDQNGAFKLITGTETKTCDAANGDVENCNNDATFKLEDYSFE